MFVSLLWNSAIEDGWDVGRLKEIPGVFSHGEAFGELEENTRDAYDRMIGQRRGSKPRLCWFPFIYSFDREGQGFVNWPGWSCLKHLWL